jgi:hypothetical protein
LIGPRKDASVQKEKGTTNVATRTDSTGGRTTTTTTTVAIAVVIDEEGCFGPRPSTGNRDDKGARQRKACNCVGAAAALVVVLVVSARYETECHNDSKEADLNKARLVVLVLVSARYEAECHSDSKEADSDKARLTENPDESRRQTGHSRCQLAAQKVINRSQRTHKADTAISRSHRSNSNSSNVIATETRQRGGRGNTGARSDSTEDIDSGGSTTLTNSESNTTSRPGRTAKGNSCIEGQHRSTLPRRSIHAAVAITKKTKSSTRLPRKATRPAGSPRGRSQIEPPTDSIKACYGNSAKGLHLYQAIGSSEDHSSEDRRIVSSRLQQTRVCA